MRGQQIIMMGLGGWIDQLDQRTAKHRLHDLITAVDESTEDWRRQI